MFDMKGLIYMTDRFKQVDIYLTLRYLQNKKQTIQTTYFRP